MEEVLVRLCVYSFVFFLVTRSPVLASVSSGVVQGSDVGYDNIVFDVVNMNNLICS